MAYDTNINIRLERDKNQVAMIKQMQKIEALNELHKVYRICAIIGYYVSPEGPNIKIDPYHLSVQITTFKPRDLNFMEVLAVNISKDPNIVKPGAEYKEYGNKYQIYTKYVKIGVPILYKALEFDTTYKDKEFLSEQDKYEITINLLSLLQDPESYISEE